MQQMIMDPLVPLQTSLDMHRAVLVGASDQLQTILLFITQALSLSTAEELFL